MGKRNLWQAVVAISIVVLLAAVLAGCGGDDNADPVVPATGTVSGQIRHFQTDQGLGGVTVTVGGQNAVTDANGNFIVQNVPVGNNQVVTITPPEWLALPNGDAILVDVQQGQDTTLNAPILLINAGELPPDPPN